MPQLAIESFQTRITKCVLATFMDMIEQGHASALTDYGFTIEQIQILTSFPAIDLTCYGHIGHFIKINIDTGTVNSFLRAVKNHETNRKQIKEYITRGASSLMLKELFGLAPSDISQLRRNQGIKESCGRVEYASEALAAIIWNTWELFAGMEEKKRWLATHKKLEADEIKTTLRQIYREIKNLELETDNERQLQLFSS
ncbi:MAG: STY4526/YPO1902 family pathogenicity island replication protein [Mariprofundales bacterium]